MAAKIGPKAYEYELYDIEVEQALLGSLLVNNGAVADLGGVIRAEHFFDPLHARIFETMAEKIGLGKRMTPLTLHAAMKADPGLITVGGHDYLANLAGAAPALPYVEDLAHVVVELSARRSLTTIGQQILDSAYDPPQSISPAEQIGAALREFCAHMDAHVPSTAISATVFQWLEPRKIPPRDWLYGRHLIRKFASATVAPGGLGKSSLGVVEDIAMASGRPLLGKPVDKPLRVWSWNLEDPPDEMQRRITAACTHFGVTEADLGGRLFVNSGRNQPCVIARKDRDGTFIVRPVIDRIVAELIAKKIDVLRIDPFVATHKVVENDNGDMEIVTKEWAGVAEAANCAVELVHHSRKIGDGEVTAESARGGGAIVATCRSVRVLNRMTKDEAARAGVENAWEFFRVTSGKANMAPPSDQSDWYRLDSVSLGNGPPNDIVGVVSPWTWPDAFESVPAGTLFLVQKAIAGANWRASDQSDDWAGKAVADVLDLDVNGPSDRARIKKLLHSWIKGGALKEVLAKDATRRERKFIQVGHWDTK